jgi:glycosyltransferase involved in cell wall biosynthesis
MKEELLSWGVEPRRVMVEGDGVEPSRFVSLPSQLEARTQWRLPSDRRIIVYVGSLVTRGVIEKGVRELLTATALLRADGEPILLWVIGGPRERVGEYQHLAAEVGLLSEDIRFEGPVHSRRVPSALAAADVCVYPAPASAHPFFLRDTSPLKIFEYLAAGRPTVCAALPPLEGVIDPSLVHFCAPGNPQALAAAIREAVRKPRTNEGARRALMERISWNARMGRILETVDK